jgi:predicted DNA-binding transcriptional regulator YafY
MPINKNAIIRYKTIDNCLRNKYRKWTLDDLIEACSEALYEYEGIDKGISRRTIQSDIQIMRSEKLGYNAPIIIEDRKYYTYVDKEYSITNIPLTNQDLNKLTEVVEILKQFKGFSHFKELDGMVQKLEDKIYTEKTHANPVIDFEKNENLKGLEFLGVLYEAILKKQVIDIRYQSFKARTPGIIIFNAYLLKEFKNRWFVVGMKQKSTEIVTLALDRIISIEVLNDQKYTENPDFNPATYYHDVIGVTVNIDARPQIIRIFVERKTAPYIITKPLHHSQQIVKKTPEGIEITIKVVFNFELEKELLGFGEQIKVLWPQKLRNTIEMRLNRALKQYQK